WSSAGLLVARTTRLERRWCSVDNLASWLSYCRNTCSFWRSLAWVWRRITIDVVTPAMAIAPIRRILILVMVWRALELLRDMIPLIGATTKSHPLKADKNPLIKRCIHGGFLGDDPWLADLHFTNYLAALQDLPAL